MSARPILLIVDDEERILNALSRSLRREGYTILTAQTAQRVRQLLEQHPHPLSLPLDAAALGGEVAIH